jgi:hypothetical protein
VQQVDTCISVAGDPVPLQGQGLLLRPRRHNTAVSEVRRCYSAAPHAGPKPTTTLSGIEIDIYPRSRIYLRKRRLYRFRHSYDSRARIDSGSRHSIIVLG